MSSRIALSLNHSTTVQSGWPAWRSHFRAQSQGLCYFSVSTRSEATEPYAFGWGSSLGSKEPLHCKRLESASTALSCVWPRDLAPIGSVVGNFIFINRGWKATTANRDEYDLAGLWGIWPDARWILSCDAQIQPDCDGASIYELAVMSFTTRLLIARLSSFQGHKRWVCFQSYLLPFCCWSLVSFLSSWWAPNEHSGPLQQQVWIFRVSAMEHVGIEEQALITRQIHHTTWLL